MRSNEGFVGWIVGCVYLHAAGCLNLPTVGRPTYGRQTMIYMIYRWQDASAFCLNLPTVGGSRIKRISLILRNDSS